MSWSREQYRCITIMVTWLQAERQFRLIHTTHKGNENQNYYTLVTPSPSSTACTNPNHP